MHERPSIKGVVLVDLVDDVRALIAGGAPEHLAALTEDDRLSVEKGISETAWYDVQFYARMMALVQSLPQPENLNLNL